MADYIAALLWLSLQPRPTFGIYWGLLAAATTVPWQFCARAQYRHILHVIPTRTHTNFLFIAVKGASPFSYTLAILSYARVLGRKMTFKAI